MSYALQENESGCWSGGVAARALEVHLSTLQRWAADGLVEPDMVTADGHMRWDADRLPREVKNFPRESR